MAAHYTTVNPGRHNTMGMAKIPIRVGGVSALMDAHVVDSPTFNVLLPAPTLHELGATIDLANNVMRVQGSKHPVPITLQRHDGCQAALSTAIDETLFSPSRHQEYRLWAARFPLPSRISIDKRLHMGEGSTDDQREHILTELYKRPILCREYTPNAPPPLPLAPLRLPLKEGSEPPHVRQFPQSQAMREQGIAEPSCSFGNMPLFLNKEATKYRLLLDAHEVNECLRKVTFNPPLLTSL
ncbi:hypothetical protein GQ54DRAFT_323929 [Martensiomyces pterosporus]|nr:hypothetical protein GQ54DRAFT_323929 [Martensiomyces pterosporus]